MPRTEIRKPLASPPARFATYAWGEFGGGFRGRSPRSRPTRSQSTIFPFTTTTPLTGPFCLRHPLLEFRHCEVFDLLNLKYADSAVPDERSCESRRNLFERSTPRRVDEERTRELLHVSPITRLF